MTARILVVDDIPANVKLLEARLLAEYFDVKTATNGQDALDICRATQVDVVLLDIMMPGMDGFEVCRQLKADPATQHIPVVFVTALDETKDRVRGLEAGADDFLTKPVNDMQLMARVKSLVRLKSLTDELRLRAAKASGIGMAQIVAKAESTALEGVRFLVADDREVSARRTRDQLAAVGAVHVEADANKALIVAAESDCDLVVVNGGAGGFDPLRLCSQLRSLDRTRSVPILYMAEANDMAPVERALEIGVNDYIIQPVEEQEFIARSRTLVRRKRYHDELRRSLENSIEMAVTDPLTGLNNRRYLDNHLETFFQRAKARNKPMSMLVIDVDHFKAFNDANGHSCGDEVLRMTARRIRDCIRSVDLVCRYGGEEFVVVMPDCTTEAASRVAERIRADVEGNGLTGAGGKALNVTVSIGSATTGLSDSKPADLFERADAALYKAKEAGRNRVVAIAA